MTKTKTININCGFDKAYDFLSDPQNWPQFAIHNVLSIEAESFENGYYRIETPRGTGALKLFCSRELGILDHELIDANEAAWKVPARIVPTEDGCHFMMTFTKPELMPHDLFDQGMLLLDEELAQLKIILETNNH